jgi:acyl-CoA synthetase (NDP forming)
VEQLVTRAFAKPREVLLEHELLDLLEAVGLPTPRRLFLPGPVPSSEPPLPPELMGRAGVLKVVSEKILHKSDVGGVVFLKRVSLKSVRQAAARTLRRLPKDLRDSVAGWLLEEAVPFEPGLGHELLLGMRHSDEFGPVFVAGFGGTYVEALSEATRDGQCTILFKPFITAPSRLAAKLERSLFFRWATGAVRGVPRIAAPETLHALLSVWVPAMERIRRAVEAHGHTVLELEFNPLVWNSTEHVWMPVDALLRLGPPPPRAPTFPLNKLRHGLHPESVAIAGVSAQSVNVGRIILRCLLEHGFPLERIHVIRDDVPTIDGARCVPSLEELPGPVDLLVVAVAAAAVPALLEQAIALGKVSGSVLLIPGGMGETEGGTGIEQQILAILGGAAPENRPALIGNNSLGIVSRPDHLDVLFIPNAKLPRIEGGPRNVALLSQSGAFMIAAMTKLNFMAPEFQISLGNQIDAQLSHFLDVLADEPGLTTYALYIEGFKPRDGERLALLTRRLVAAGRDVVLYKAGRSALGRAATRGHTASITGDYQVFRELMADAGALLADSFSDFVNLVRVSATLHDRPVSGRRLALMSNAGYEAVGLADNLRGAHHRLEAATLARTTTERIAAALAKARLAGIVSAANPLDVTPMANDAVYEECMRAMLDDPDVDAAIFGMVPLTAMVQTLPRGLSERDVFDAPGSFANRTIALFRDTPKPLVVAIDAGRLYDALADYMQLAGVPVFRNADLAACVLGTYIDNRLGRPVPRWATHGHGRAARWWSRRSVGLAGTSADARSGRDGHAGTANPRSSPGR